MDKILEQFISSNDRFLVDIYVDNPRFKIPTTMKPVMVERIMSERNLSFKKRQSWLSKLLKR